MRLPQEIHGGVAVLATSDDGGPAAIPVSAVVRVDDRRLLVGIARRRRSLARLRHDPRVAMVLLGTGYAATLRGVAEVVRDPLEAVEHVAAVLVAGSGIEDAMNPATIVHAGVRWGWADGDADKRHRSVLAELADLAQTIRSDVPGDG